MKFKLCNGLKRHTGYPYLSQGVGVMVLITLEMFLSNVLWMYLWYTLKHSYKKLCYSDFVLQLCFDLKKKASVSNCLCLRLDSSACSGIAVRVHWLTWQRLSAALGPLYDIIWKEQRILNASVTTFSAASWWLHDIYKEPHIIYASITQLLQ